MLDDLRNLASQPMDEEPPEPPETQPHKSPESHFLGMNAAQRFVVAFLLFLMVVILGTLFLVVTEKVAINIPGLF
jgi:hypothetical protein